MVCSTPRHRVLLLEAGGQDDHFWIPIPVGYLYTIANPRTDWCYRTEPDEHLAGLAERHHRGRRAAALGVGDDDGVARLEDGDLVPPLHEVVRRGEAGDRQC